MFIFFSRSLLYYVFTSAVALFSGVIRNTTHPDIKEDLQSLNMGAAFFTTLLPADGGSKSVKFMATMCATFERIAKKVTEKGEKEHRARDGNRNVQRKNLFATNAVPKPDGTSVSANFRRAGDFVQPGQPSDLNGGMKAPNTESLPNTNPFHYSYMGSTFNSDPSAGHAMSGVNTMPASGYQFEDVLDSSFGLPYLHGMQGIQSHFTGPSVPLNPTPVPLSTNPSQLDQMFFPRGYLGNSESAASAMSSGAVLETSTFSNSNPMEGLLHPQSWDMSTYNMS